MPNLNDDIPSANILVVDDTPANLQLLVNILSKQGYQVRPAPNGALALRAAQSAPPDLILLDIMMPGMDGYEVCRALKADERIRHVPVIFISAIGEIANKIKALRMGGVDYVTKPFQPEEVIARVETHLTNQHLQQQLRTQNEELQQEIIERKRTQAMLTRTNQALSKANSQMQNELALARQIQHGFLQPPQPEWVYPQVNCYTRSARELGGDFYHYYRFPTTQTNSSPRYAFTVGDVSGKGVSAALIMAHCLSQLQESFNHAYSLTERIQHLDDIIAPYTRPYGQNCALCCVEVIPLISPQISELRFINAGCIPPYIKRITGEVEVSETGGLPLGLGLNTQYEETILSLNQGDLIILTSDGLIEAYNPATEMFGFERLQQAIEDGPPTNATAMFHHLKETMLTFTQDAEQHDDITIMVIQV